MVSERLVVDQVFIGLIITPSFVCHNSHELRANETYEVLLKNTPGASNTSANLMSPLNNQLLLNREKSLANQTAFLYQPVAHHFSAQHDMMMGSGLATGG
jgi:hypothetical protein